MGSYKNKHNSREHSQSWLQEIKNQARRNKSLTDKDIDEQHSGLNTEQQDREETRVSIGGSRITSVDKQEYAEDITKHSTQCGGSITLSVKIGMV